MKALSQELGRSKRKRASTPSPSRSPKKNNKKSPKKKQESLLLTKKYPAVKKVLTVKKLSSMEKQEAETKKKEIRRMEQGKQDTKRRTPYGLSYASCNPPKIGAKPTWP
jgi:hypothetical protein